MRYLILLMCLLACGPVQARPAYFIDDGRLRTEAHGMSMPLPNGWGQDSAGEARAPVLARLVRESGRAQLVLIVEGAPSDKTFPAGAQIQKEMQTSVRGFQVVETKPWTLGGSKFQEYIATGSADTRKYSLFVGFANDRMFLFLLMANHEDGDKARAEVVNALRGIQFFEAKDKAPTRSNPAEAT